MDISSQKIAIVGGGLVGSLNACILAKRGFQIHLFELREDIRKAEIVEGRSINLALSCRGIAALSKIGVEAGILNNVIPMYARMIHDLNGNRRRIPYGTPEQCINSVDRRALNELLLSTAEATKNIELHFGYRFKDANFSTGQATFVDANGEEYSDTFDLIVGNDGAFSAVRREMAKQHGRFNFSQEFISHGYMELHFPAAPESLRPLERNYLHIWPRNEYMMIALPNPNGSFTGTLFMPFEKFEMQKTPEDLLNFFKKNFPDAVELLGKEALVKTYFSNSPSSLVCIKCSPYHLMEKCVLMGDAAHAMVPFYGQGMNCGFEDCLVFCDILDKCDNDLKKSVPEFTKVRMNDCHVICELAMLNYVEMRKSVNSNWFLLRKSLDNILHKLLPNVWVPLYTMVSFTRTPYSKCFSDRKWQDKIITAVLVSGGAASLLTAAWIVRHASSMHTVNIASHARSIFDWSSHWSEKILHRITRKETFFA